MDQFASYQQFFSPEEAEPIIAVLKENGIPYTFNKTRGILDAVIIGVNPNDQYDLRIPQHEFRRVSELLIANTKVNLDELEKDYYLFSFTCEELENIIANPDEWSAHDYVVAVELLKRKGESLPKEKLEELRESRFEVLAKSQKKFPGFGLAIAYLLPLWSGLRMWTPNPLAFSDSNKFFISLIGLIGEYVTLYGGIVGAFIGLSVWKFQKTLPNGSRVYHFVEPDRQHGRIIFWIGIGAIISLATALIYTTATGNPAYELIFG